MEEGTNIEGDVNNMDGDLDENNNQEPRESTNTEVNVTNTDNDENNNPPREDVENNHEERTTTRAAENRIPAAETQRESLRGVQGEVEAGSVLRILHDLQH